MVHGGQTRIVTERHVIFSHGQESGPWGRKISALAEIARAAGWQAHSVDYRGIPEPDRRTARLIEHCEELSGERVLVGSSVGGFVSVAAAPVLHPRGLFLIAPALYLPQLPPLPQEPLNCRAVVVHGFRDEIVPYEDSVRFANAQRATLLLLEGDHLLHEQLGDISHMFGHFLTTLPALAGLAV
jgi:predicted alpha/beta hydrolase family esterase